MNGLKGGKVALSFPRGLTKRAHPWGVLVGNGGEHVPALAPSTCDQEAWLGVCSGEAQSGIVSVSPVRVPCPGQ